MNSSVKLIRSTFHPRLSERRIGKGLLFHTGLCFFLLLLLCSNAFSAPNRILPDQLKAVYIYNFFNFVTWKTSGPSQHEGEMVIGVLGNSAVNKTLEELRGSLVREGKAPFSLIKFNKIEDLGDSLSCRILLIDADLSNDFGEIIKALNNQPILTVSDSEEFVYHGGIIGMVQREGKIRFKINRAAASQKGLNFNSQLLNAAIHVIE